MRPKVKICGLMRMEDVAMCVRHGANMLGFVVEYPRPVPWNLSACEAANLMAACEAKTCVVTDGSAEKILELARRLRPDFVQLHDCGAALCDALRDLGVGVIATLRPRTADLEQAARRFCDAGAQALLLDPRDAINGGTADLSAFERVRCAVNCPVVLAGGIAPDNVREIVREARPEMIDLMTGVERCPGVKDERKVLALFEALGS